MNPASAYGADGVNISAGDEFSSFAGQIARETWEFSPYVKVHDHTGGHFRGPRGYEFVNLPAGAYLGQSADGTGTKTILTSLAKNHEYTAQDLAAMTCGDHTRYGGLPVMLSNVLDVSSLGEVDSNTYVMYQQLIYGLQRVARKYGLVLLTGETAELGVCVGSDNPEAETKFNWAGFCQAIYHPDALITGEHITPGQIVVSGQERGFRSNGLSFVRKALRYQFGESWGSNPNAQSAIQAAAEPSVLYDKFLARVNGWFSKGFKDRIPISAIAHITGGGIISKFADDILFRAGHSAELNNLFDPPDIMRSCVEWRQLDGTVLSDLEIYRTLHGGQGILMVLNPEYYPQLKAVALEEGIVLQECGKIIKSHGTPKLTVHSKFSGKVFHYPPE